VEHQRRIQGGEQWDGIVNSGKGDIEDLYTNRSVEGILGSMSQI
jgi:hypothetical protein